MNCIAVAWFVLAMSPLLLIAAILKIYSAVELWATFNGDAAARDKVIWRSR